MNSVFETSSEIGTFPEGDQDFSTPPASDLVDHVQRRAAEILREMDEPLQMN
jgi:hypothetical protein